MIKRAFQYFFYRVYTGQRKLWGEADVPEYKGVFAVSIMIFINFLTIIILFGGILGKQLILIIPKAVFILFLVLLFIINGIIFLKNKDYIKIEKKFKKESEQQRKKRTYFIWGYILGSIAAYVLSLIITK